MFDFGHINNATITVVLKGLSPKLFASKHSKICVTIEPILDVDESQYT
jgi:hypothetical protein